MIRKSQEVIHENTKKMSETASKPKAPSTCTKITPSALCNTEKNSRLVAYIRAYILTIRLSVGIIATVVLFIK